jgi:hypothetical protein
MKSAAEEIVEFERQVRAREKEAALKRFYNRTNYEATTDYTPFDSIIAREPADLDDLTEDELSDRLEQSGLVLAVKPSKRDAIAILHAFAANERAAQLETCNRLLVFFAADGPDPDYILRRVVAVGAHMAVSPYCDFTLREKKALLGGSHGTHHWLNRKVCEDPLRRKGVRAWKSPGQKSLSSRKSYSRSQKGNTNRKKNKRLQ